MENELGNDIDIKYLTDSEFALNEFKFNSSIYLKKQESSLNEILPYRVNLPCVAVNTNSYVVDSMGNFYSCLDNICDNNFVIGQLKDIDHIVDGKVNLSYYNETPFNDELCLCCKFLPICMGGCPKNYKKKGYRDCVTTRYNMDILFEFIINEIL
ncbi:MAG: SPASM domain-containing protein [Lachnospirales bacterium]